MPVTGFSHCNLRADRATLDALRDFYVDIVGLSIGERPPFSHYGYWLYIGDQAVLHLSEARPNEQRLPHAAGTFDHVAFSSVGHAEFEAHLRARGIAYRSATVPGARQKQIFFKDPTGNGVELNFDDLEEVWVR
ncbi:VOC family protein [Trinickia caryophylli]|uniref:Glyoxylase I family protein n=1 Tax=Trinickia caryophylli TaxID=28094 RepID=A0A1X7FGJ5_TRICW|nr:VOC family protein [Trinickia caryophylli]PMS13355.1 diguanylate cyclase [Trinickia caryophylli]TRX19196.1 diguanylate cyclase [Trinickia caryophylli]WQE13503.1 diguanylate cyclase [Trinickia caryophylli]SMF51642.1 glyoxylase I family protein [Trinickia caryophylli]GLU33964.1 diguanylate cyclase [Trinickia caryophylli]